MDTLNKWLAKLEQLSAEQPLNPDIRIVVARNRAMRGLQLWEAGDTRSALAQEREAESIYRKLMAEHPGQLIYVRALAKQLPQVAKMSTSAGDRDSAIGLYHEGVTLYEPLFAGKGNITEDCAGLADAHRDLSGGHNRLGHAEEAIAEGRTAIAIYDRVIARDPKTPAWQRGRSETSRQLALVYESRSDYRSAVEMSLQALPFLEAEYNRDPGEPDRTIRLWHVLGSLRREYRFLGEYDRAIDAARRAVEIMEKSAALEPEDLERANDILSSYGLLSTVSFNAGRRAESLAASRQGVIAANRTPMETIASAHSRWDFAASYLQFIQSLWRWDEQEEALPLCRRVIPVLEALMQGDPKNPLFRQSLDQAYRFLGTLEGDLGNYPALIENYRKALQLDKAGQNDIDNQNWIQRSAYQARIAVAQAIGGESDAARQSWRDALQTLESARAIAERARAANSRNFGPMRDIIQDDRRMAFTLERLGDRKQALDVAQQALSLAAALVRGDPQTRANQELLEDQRGISARLTWLTSGPTADFRSILGGEATPRGIQLALARGWRLYAVDSLQVEDFSAEAAAKAVEIDRGLLRDDAQQVSQLSLALDLEALGKAYRFAARRSESAQAQGDYLKGRQAFIESRDLLAIVQRSGALPESNTGDPAAVAGNIQIVEARLTALQGDKTLTSKSK
jgi:tetratricopeptide (TPR) repeat protein